MATERDVDSAPASASAAATTEGQSKRPSLNHRASDHSDTNNNNNNNNTSAAPQQRQKHQKQRRVGGLHGRVPSNNKGLHKQHANSSKVNLNRRQASPTEAENQIPQRPAPPHRRATSEVKLTHNSSSSNVPKAPSQSNLKRNRSHVEVSKRNRSSEKLNRTSSGTGINKANKNQVHFDLGSDDQEDEWVDASGSNSPYLSRKGSINSSTQSSVKPAESAASSRPQTPSEPAQLESSSSERSTAQHKEYLTSRLLQRSASSTQVAPPKMSTDIVQAVSTHVSPVSTEHDTSPPAGSHEDGLTSRFVEVPGSGITSEGSFYNPARGGSHRSEILPRRPHSVINFSQSHEYSDMPPPLPRAVDDEITVLVPTAAKRTSVPAETSRTQQKLNLQRASSTIEPGQSVTGVVGVVGASPLIGVGDAGHDGGNSRDPRVGKLLERHGMEYLVVRRHQNPIARSLNRLGRLPSVERIKRIPRTNTGSTTNSRRSVDLPVRHIRNTSGPDGRGAVTPKRAASIRTNGVGSSFEGDDMHRLSERLSGSSLVGEEEDGTAALLRNLWEKPMDLSASTD
ncbi:hypothetical protein PT974_03622 [Cladobotryum mycophilum]|uniref:Uncharacterized protein n=1 Tax=Cladobotryum mycophilum TaxID=491253 RepID=A0ABR0ST72_9HYPO